MGEVDKTFNVAWKKRGHCNVDNCKHNCSSLIKRPSYIPQELWSLVDFVTEGKLLGSRKTFKTEFENPIVRVSDRRK